MRFGFGFRSTNSSSGGSSTGANSSGLGQLNRGRSGKKVDDRPFPPHLEEHPYFNYFPVAQQNYYTRSVISEFKKFLKILNDFWNCNSKEYLLYSVTVSEKSISYNVFIESLQNQVRIQRFLSICEIVSSYLYFSVEQNKIFSIWVIWKYDMTDMICYTLLKHT